MKVLLSVLIDIVLQITARSWRKFTAPPELDAGAGFAAAPFGSARIATAFGASGVVSLRPRAKQMLKESLDSILVFMTTAAGLEYERETLLVGIRQAVKDSGADSEFEG